MLNRLVPVLAVMASNNPAISNMLSVTMNNFIVNIKNLSYCFYSAIHESSVTVYVQFNNDMK